jgi:AcrR family transcriptional regulator
MARPKEFDKGTALEAALDVFREHGYAATSTTMLTDAMQIGRQSLYDTFGDKWQLYRTVVERYNDGEVAEHLAALATGPRPINGLNALLARVVREAGNPCMGMGSINEFGSRLEELNQLHATAGRRLHDGLTQTLAAAQRDGDISATLNVDQAAAFIMANIAGLRMAARGGAGPAELQELAHFAFRALR